MICLFSIISNYFMFLSICSICLFSNRSSGMYSQVYLIHQVWIQPCLQYPIMMWNLLLRKQLQSMGSYHTRHGETSVCSCTMLHKYTKVIQSPVYDEFKCVATELFFNYFGIWSCKTRLSCMNYKTVNLIERFRFLDQ